MNKTKHNKALYHIVMLCMCTKNKNLHILEVRPDSLYTALYFGKKKQVIPSENLELLMFSYFT